MILHDKSYFNWEHLWLFGGTEHIEWCVIVIYDPYFRVKKLGTWGSPILNKVTRLVNNRTSFTLIHLILGYEHTTLLPLQRNDCKPLKEGESISH